MAEELEDLLMRRAAITLPVRERLAQDEIWIDGEGREIPLDQISANHARNIIKFFEPRAAVLYAGACDHMALEINPFQGDIARDSFDDAIDALFDTDPIGWFHDQPLIRALDMIAYGRQQTAMGM